MAMWVKVVTRIIKRETIVMKEMLLVASTVDMSLSMTTRLAMGNKNWTVVISLLSSTPLLGNHSNKNQLHAQELVLLRKPLNLMKTTFKEWKTKLLCQSEEKSGSCFSNHNLMLYNLLYKPCREHLVMGFLWG